MYILYFQIALFPGFNIKRKEMINTEDAVRQMEEPELLSEVPPILKRLAKTVAYAFYDPELVVTIALLTNFPCIDEDTLLEKLHFDKRQLRGVLSRLKNDKLVKQRQIKEKQPDTSNFNVFNFYFINYKLFVNVVKYKLDHIRRKLENEEQQARNRPSFQCLQCSKHYSDLEVDRLIDFESGLFRCSYCNGDVEEDANHINTQTNGSSLGRFNEQMEQIYSLLKECENINLAPEVLEPTPSTASIKSSSSKSNSGNNKSGWSSKQVKDLYDQNIQINVREEVDANKEAKKSKVLPVWMSESTVYNEESNDSVSSLGSVLTRSDTPVIPESVEEPSVSSSVNQEDHEIMSHLLAHESSNKKPRLDTDVGIGDKPSKDESSSDSEDTPSPEQKSANIATTSASGGVTEVADVMDSDDDEESEMMVKVGAKQYPMDEITDEVIEKMTKEEHDVYLKMYHDAYADYY